MGQPRNRGEYVSVWVGGELAADLRRIAERRTSGNRSMAVRHLLDWAVLNEKRGHVDWIVEEGGYES